MCQIKQLCGHVSAGDALVNSAKTAPPGRLLRLWYEQPSRPSVLQPLSWLYGAIVSARRGAYQRGWMRSHAVGKPAIVVGNLTVGGTGKTPLTIWLANQLRQRGFEVGLVSRGYGRERNALREVVADSSWQEVGDEPLILHCRTQCMTFVASDRVAAARALVARRGDGHPGRRWPATSADAEGLRNRRGRQRSRPR